MHEVDVQDFLGMEGPIIDVRSPAEYLQGHIPGAVNFPLFTDDERADVGTAYKQQGKEKAISLGLKYVTPKISDFLTKINSYSHAKIHCWRGGLRSSSMATLFRTAGVPAVTMIGGYKSFRRWALDVFSKHRNYKIIGGLTGTGKTAILKALEGLGEQVIDLEELACHRGSAFGFLDHNQQPTTEQFQNAIALKLSSFDPSKHIWIEDESRTIGLCHIPEELFNHMRSFPLILIERPIEAREEILQKEYGKTPIESLISAVLKIQKKLGGEKTQEAITHLREGRLREAGAIFLEYYDSAYQYGVSKRGQEVLPFNAQHLTPQECAEQLIRD